MYPKVEVHWESHLTTRPWYKAALKKSAGRKARDRAEKRPGSRGDRHGWEWFDQPVGRKQVLEDMKA